MSLHNIMDQEQIRAERRRKQKEYHKNYATIRRFNNYQNVGRRCIVDKPIEEMTEEELVKYKRRVAARKYRAKNLEKVRQKQKEWERKNRLQNTRGPRPTAEERKFSVKHGHFLISFD
jgi:hypothetical protein